MSTADFHPYRNVRSRDDHKEDSIIRNDENFLVIEPGLYYPEQHGVNFHHRFEENLGLMEEMRFKAFHTPFDWSRIYPKRDKEEPNETGLRYHDRLVTSTCFYEVEPSMTISHYEMPVHLVKKYGGWLNRSLVDFSAIYYNILFERYHGRIKYWIVLSQINLTTFNSLGILGNRAKDFMEAEYQGTHHQFLACVRTGELAGKYKGQTQVGTVFSGKLAYPTTCRPRDMFSNTKKNQMQYFFPDVQLRGFYPAYAFRSPEENHINIYINLEDERLLRGNPMDFLSTGYYYTKVNDSLKNIYAPMNKGIDPYLEKTEWDREIDPVSLRVNLNHYSDRYPGVPVYVTESGYGAVDRLEGDGAVHDPYRIDYLRQHMIQMKEAIADGVPLKGYMMWMPMGIASCSLTEMKGRYGLIYVGQDDKGNGSRQRHRGGSFYWYQKVIESNGEELQCQKIPSQQETVSQHAFSGEIRREFHEWK